MSYCLRTNDVTKALFGLFQPYLQASVSHCYCLVFKFLFVGTCHGYISTLSLELTTDRKHTDDIQKHVQGLQTKVGKVGNPYRLFSGLFDNAPIGSR